MELSLWICHMELSLSLAMSVNMVGSDMGIKILMENFLFFYAAQHERKQRIKINPASGIGLQPKGGGNHLAMKP